MMKEGSTHPPPDYLVHFVVESSNDEKPVCANCDKGDRSPMFFCDTCGTYCLFCQKNLWERLQNGIDSDHSKIECVFRSDEKYFLICIIGQALCGTCRDETHRAKMFSQHDIIHMSKRTKEIHKKVFGPNSVFVKYTAEGRVRESFSLALTGMLCMVVLRLFSSPPRF